MQIKELIQKLSTYPDTSEVIVYDGMDPSDLCLVTSLEDRVNPLTGEHYIHLYGDIMAPSTQPYLC